jgi:hypothetical protein
VLNVRMNVVIHAGFHKSGTTSIQTALLRHPNTNFFYPVPEIDGPGHSQIARNTLDKKSTSYNPDLLLQIVDDYEKSSPTSTESTLIFSSECFTDYKKFKGIEKLAREHKVHLILTRRPIQEVLPSWSKELIKHGHKHPFMSRKSLKRGLGWMQFDPNKIRRFLDSANFDKVDVISTSSCYPDYLFDSFRKILGIDLPTLMENPSLDDSMTSNLLFLNKKHPSLSLEEKLKIASEAEQEIEPIVIDSKTVDFMNELEDTIMSFFISLADQKRVALHSQ